MARRPSRAQMNNWLAGRLLKIRIRPSNPADIQRLAQLAISAEEDLRDLASIASELGWHADASLDYAHQLILDYDKARAPRPSETERQTDAD